MSGAVWDEVTVILRSQGHKVYCPTLPNAQTHNLNDHLNEVSRVITDNNLDQVILAGHSYGGLVITGVFNKMPDKITRLVFFDTSIPENGKSLRQIMNGYTPGSFEEAKVPAFRPFTDPLIFDQEKFNKVPKIYVNCKRSEFFDSCCRQAFTIVINTCRQNNWDYFVLDSGHLCMKDRPDETAAILDK